MIQTILSALSHGDPVLAVLLAVICYHEITLKKINGKLQKILDREEVIRKILDDD